MQHCLIVARSARALAESAIKAGYHVHAIDAFADNDTQKLADTIKRCDFSESGFDMRQLVSMVSKLIAGYPIRTVVIGAGIESQPHMAASFGNTVQMYCNPSAIIQTLTDPFQFKALLQQGNIPTPDIYKCQPQPPGTFLRKRIGGMGGEHVVWGTAVSNTNSSDYFQSYVAGKVYSAVFLADGTNASIVGFSRQWQNATNHDYPFIYGGAHSVEPEHGQCRKVNEIVQAIVADSGLKGMCGMDYIVDNDAQIVVLETNPRPPATFELHEGEWPLFAAHISSFEKPVTIYRRCHQHRAYIIIYTDKDLQISRDFKWPTWAKDIPALGSRIYQSQPVCTVHAEAEAIPELKKIVMERKQEIEEMLLLCQAFTFGESHD